MNKFEALKMFQGWPPGHQRLCAECWIETGEDRPAVQVWTTADKIQTAGELVQRGVSIPSDCIDQGEMKLGPMPKVAKAAAVPTRKHHSRLAWSAAESEYLLKLASEDQPLYRVVFYFLSKYPGRSRDAVRRRVWGIRSGKPESEAKY
jgi:hypothetical protein